MPRPINPKIEIEIKEGDNFLTAEQAEYIKRSFEFYEYHKKRNRDNARKRYKPKKISPVEISEEKSD